MSHKFRINSTLAYTSVFAFLILTSCQESQVQLTHGTDESAGGGPAYIISTPIATYYLEKEGGGLSSMLDKDGIDWIGFHNRKGSAHKGEIQKITYKSPSHQITISGKANGIFMLIDVILP